MSGKGSNRRPQSVSEEKFQSNWDTIFNKKSVTDDYQDLLSTEDCFLDMLEKLQEIEKGC
jgi:hypothetical protein